MDPGFSELLQEITDVTWAALQTFYSLGLLHLGVGLRTVLAEDARSLGGIVELCVFPLNGYMFYSCWSLMTDDGENGMQQCLSYIMAHAA
jgi:hypothetical protein